ARTDGKRTAEIERDERGGRTADARTGARTGSLAARGTQRAARAHDASRSIRTSPVKRALLACVIALAPLLHGDARADAPAHDANETQAEGLFRAAKAAFDGGDYRSAAVGFEAAQRIAPHPFTEFNAALAWDLGGDHIKAANLFASAL